MLNIKEIEWAISQLEQEESSFQAYQKLASLYTIRDKLMGEGSTMDKQRHIEGYSRAAQSSDLMIGDYGSSEFLKTINGKEASSVWSVINELMETLQVVNPRVYNSVLRKLNRI